MVKHRLFGAGHDTAQHEHRRLVRAVPGVFAAVSAFEHGAQGESLVDRGDEESAAPFRRQGRRDLLDTEAIGVRLDHRGALRR